MANIPEFDPNQAYTVPEFDPSQPFEAAPDRPKARKLDLSKFEHTSIAEPIVNAISGATPEERAGGSKAALDTGVDAMLLGGSGEASGGTQALLDMLQSGAHKVAPGMVNESPTQVNSRLKEQGFTGMGPTDTAGIYNQGMNERDALLKQEQEQYPMSSLVGQVGGSVVGAMATGGYGTGAIASKVAPLLGATETGFIAAGKQGMAPLAKAIGTEAISSIPMGATQGALSAKPGERLQEGAIGGATGSLSAIAARGAMEGIPALAKAAGGKVQNGIENFYTPKKGSQDIKLQESEAYNAGTRGENWNDPKFLEGKSQAAENLGMTGSKGSLSNMAGRESEKAAQALITVDNQLGQEVGNALENAAKSGKTFSLFEPETRQAYADLKATLRDRTDDLNIIFTPRMRDIEAQLNSSGILSPVDARDFKNELYTAINKYKMDTNPSSVNITQKLSNLARSLDNNLRTQIPEYAAASDRFKLFRSKVTEPIISNQNATTFNVNGKQTPTGLSNFGDDIEGNRTELVKTMKYFIDDLSKPGATRDSKAFFNKIKDNISEYQNIESSLKKPNSETINKTLGNVVGDIENASIKQRTFDVVHNPAKLSTPATEVSPYAMAKNVVKSKIGDPTRIKVANFTGRLQRGVQDGSISPAFQEALNKLKAIDPTDKIKTNALLNTLLQNNTIRDYLSNMGEEPSE